MPRKRTAIQLVYSVDVTLRDEAAVLPASRRTSTSTDAGHRLPLRRPCAGEVRPAPWSSAPAHAGCSPALILAQMGLRPIILERGKVVRERTKDTWGLWRRSVLNPESNVQFGEGGAGTFSDGKLYSQIKDPRTSTARCWTEFVKAGAPEEILTEAHPHIGTFRLVTMVESMRETIEELGGEYRFGHQVDGPRHRDRRAGVPAIRGLIWKAASTSPPTTSCWPSATARATPSHMLHERGVFMSRPSPSRSASASSIRNRWIDRCRFGRCAGNPIWAPPTTSCRITARGRNGRTVYSFCMCPGGTVVAATSEPGRVVTNGMSQYSRAMSATPIRGSSSRRRRRAIIPATAGRHRASSGIGRSAGLHVAADRATRRPASGRRLSSPQPPLYLAGQVVPPIKPGVTPTDLAPCLPDFAIAAMREALPVFGRQIPAMTAPMR
jgi:hypothetical protein